MYKIYNDTIELRHLIYNSAFTKKIRLTNIFLWLSKGIKWGLQFKEEEEENFSVCSTGCVLLHFSIEDII